MSRLENWSIISYDDSPYLAPELIEKRIVGEIYDDDRFDDGKTVITSPVVEFNIKEHFAKTYSETIYILGKIDPKYEQWLKDNNIPFETE